jgi:hypothetical protein
LRGCLKRLYLKAYQKAISNGHVERLNWKTGLKGWLENTYQRTISRASQKTEIEGLKV